MSSSEYLISPSLVAFRLLCIWYDYTCFALLIRFVLKYISLQLLTLLAVIFPLLPCLYHLVCHQVLLVLFISRASGVLENA